MDLHFELPKEQSSIIKVIGVGGGGGNAVDYMFEKGIVGVNFVICNTDQQALEKSPVPNKVQLGPEITQGLGAGSRPEIGREATEESMEDIKALLNKNTKMVFITAGMGGGTGTGGAPVLARIAKEMGILTVGIVTTPFSFEGRRKLQQAEKGIQEMKQYVDSILVISNDKIREMYGNLTRSEAFSNADDILCTAAKSISEIITVPGEINVDFADVQYVMENSGVAIMGAYMAEGENRAMRCVQGALNSPLLNDNNISGAQNILLNISSGSSQVTIDEITAINDYIQDAAGNEADVILGVCDDPSLGDKLSLTVIATGFEEVRAGAMTVAAPPSKVVHRLEENEQKKEEAEMRLIQTPPAPTASPNIEPPVPVSMDPEPVIEEPAQQEEISLEQPAEETPAELQFEIKQKPVEPEPQQEQQLSFYVSEKQPKAQAPESDSQKDKAIEDRKRTLRELSYKWNNPQSMNEMEKEPAYKRRGVELNDVPHSAEDEISRYSLGEGSDDRPEIKKNNSFLHDNVD